MVRLHGRSTECGFLEALLADTLGGRSRVVVVKGEAGCGKSALLDFMANRAGGWRIATAVGIESEMELAYSGLHQLCAPMLEDIDRLPTPQRDALATIFGLRPGAPPDPFLVGLATLTLLAEVAERQPLLCVIDDAQWLDAASARVLLFVGRRLLAERIALVCATRTDPGSEILDGLPGLSLNGLEETDARALLLESLQGRFDAVVCDQIVSESRGNPLALLELPRSWNLADLGGGFALPALHAVVGKIEQSYTKRLRALPAKTQLLILAAAAEPLGDPVLLQRAAELLGVDMRAADPAIDAGLLEIPGRIKFAHPLVRSVAYTLGSDADRRRVHRALAEATDAATDPDRRAWHRAQGTRESDEEIAAELERSAGRARARGGVAAAAAFLERAAALSPDPATRASRSLAAAESKQLAGAPQAALRLLTIAVDGSLGELEAALAQRLKGQVALDLQRGGEAVPHLLDAARRLESTDRRLARRTYLDALYAASFVSVEMLYRAADAARHAPEAEGAPSPDDLLLAGLAVRYTEGYAASASLLKRALAAYGDQDLSSIEDVRWPGIARRVAADMLDDDAWHNLATRSAQLARDRGALGVLPLALNNVATLRSFEGDLQGAAALIQESDAILEATGGGKIALGRLILDGFRGDESGVSQLVEADTVSAAARGQRLLAATGGHALALLYNGHARYDTALTAAESASEADSIWSLPELVEAASRCGRTVLAADALERLTECTQAAGTEWALGLEARSRALLNEGSHAEELYREAIHRLGPCRMAPDRARSDLLYGEWLRREGRRLDAREHLRKAHTMLTAMGMQAFAERARRELAATGEKVRRQTATREVLTAQEAQIAQLARDGYSNPEIGGKLFLSPRTVEWHLRNVFGKLGISSRRELAAAPPNTQLAPNS